MRRVPSAEENPGSMGEAPRQPNPDELFSLEAQRTSIPVPLEVLPPPEEIRRRKLVRVAIVASAILIVIAIGLTVRHFVHHAAVERTALAAGDFGTPAAIEEALATLDSGERPGLRARLHATLALAGAEPLETARAAFAEVPADDPDEASERVKASVYLALAQGELAEADAAAAQLIAQGTFASETAFALALPEFATGALPAARAQSEAAVSVRPGAPRYAALLARAAALGGDPAAGRAALDAVPEEARATGAYRVADLEVGLAEGAFAAVEERAAATLAEADAGTLAPSQRAWVGLLYAEAALGRGRPWIARERAQSIDLSQAPGDVFLGWRQAALLARAGAHDTAAAAIAALPADGPLSDPTLRPLARAELQLAAHDPSAALAILEDVPATPDAVLLAGRARRARADGRDDLLAARNAFARAAESAPSHAAPLALALQAEMGARLELADTAALADRALTGAPEQPAVVAAVARVRIALGEAEPALALVDALLTRAPDLSAHVELLRAKGHALMALERWADAATTLRSATERAPTDLDLQTGRAEVASELGERDEAKTAFEAALAVAPEDTRALRGYVALLLDRNEVAEAEAPMRRLLSQRLRDQDFVILHARYLVASGAGYSGMSAVQRGLNRFRRIGYLRTAMAELLLQAGFYGRAAVMFVRAATLDEDRVDSYVGAALAHAMDGKNNRVNQVLGDLREAVADTADADFSERPRYLALRARVDLNLGRTGSARTLAERALAADPRSNEAHLALADVESRRRGVDPRPHLEAAAGGPRAQLPAIGRLALMHGGSPEGCALAERYRQGRPRGDYTDDVRALLASEACAEQ